MNIFLLKQKNLHDSSGFTPGGRIYIHMFHLAFTLRILWRFTLPAGFEDCFLFLLFLGFLFCDTIVLKTFINSPKSAFELVK